MTCESARELAEAYLDGELDAGLHAQAREHLAACESCAALDAEQSALRAGIREHAPYYRAPAALEGRVLRAVRRADRPAAGAWRWIAMAAAVVLIFAASWRLATRHPADLIAQEILASHVRSLMATHLLDVPSTDRHTVKPWFNGKLDFSPDVRDFADRGFRLIGGRLDYIGSRPVAALVYQRRQHVINVFTWPSAPDRGQSQFVQNGYTAIPWNRAGMVWWAVSDLNAAELREFVRLLQQ